MPKYFYICSECKVKKSIYHSMTEVVESCEGCNTTGSLKKIPSSFSFETAKEVSVKTGQIVKESIEEFREDLKNQKDELRSEYSEKNE
tara:strand:- start:25072 stop:25335 length:264 start_codon:yes stop_codon:yes gene_type:complete